MIWLFISLLLVLIFAVVYVFLVMPRVVDVADMDLLSTDYAHRGLHSATVPENSLTAFYLAMREGYGIELDVQLSADGSILVFHDDDLSRMCGVKGRICRQSSTALRQLRLAGSNERIPLLQEVLELIEGRVPLLIEIKATENEEKLCRELSELLDTYSGAFAVQSFNPKTLSYFKKYRPRFARGLIVTRVSARLNSSRQSPLLCFALTHQLTNVIARPDFIVIDKRMTREPAFVLATRLFRSKAFVWTVRTPRQYRFCRKHSFFAIFENIKPK